MGDSLGDRMKGYESVPRISLMRRTPAIVRVDGKAFHTLTRGLDKPYDRRFVACMQHVAKELCRHLQGAQLSYVQSDEVSVLLVDYQTHDTQGWFDYQVQKMVSVSASVATLAFNTEWVRQFPGETWGALFDSRVFSMPREEVVNYFLWRQQDATRNSIQGLGQKHFSPKQLHGKNCDEIQEMLWQTHEINWGQDVTPENKRGTCAVRAQESERWRWVIDYEIPVFSQDRAYIQRLVDQEGKPDSK